MKLTFATVKERSRNLHGKCRCVKNGLMLSEYQNESNSSQMNCQMDSHLRDTFLT